MKTNTLFGIFLGIVFVSVGSFFFLGLFSHEEAKQQALASQGIRLIENTTFITNESNNIPATLKVGDLLLGSDENVYSVMEIRQSPSDNSIYVLVSWKYLFDFSTIEEFYANPFQNSRTYEIQTFMTDKQLVSRQDLSNLFTELQTSQKRIQSILRERQTQRPLSTGEEINNQTSRLRVVTPTREVEVSQAPVVEEN